MPKLIPFNGSIDPGEVKKFLPSSGVAMELEKLFVSYANADDTLSLQIIDASDNVIDTLYTSPTLSNATGKINIREKLMLNDAFNYISSRSYALQLANNTNVALTYNAEFLGFRDSY